LLMKKGLNQRVLPSEYTCENKWGGTKKDRGHRNGPVAKRQFVKSGSLTKETTANDNFEFCKTRPCRKATVYQIRSPGKETTANDNFESCKTRPCRKATDCRICTAVRQLGTSPTSRSLKQGRAKPCIGPAECVFHQGYTPAEIPEDNLHERNEFYLCCRHSANTSKQSSDG